MLKIEPIKLLSGTHSDTGTTGQGCFMNVIAYLNGEPQITDHSPCVCPVVRPIAIWLNDYMSDDERPALIPYIERAMGSATDDKDELVRRAWLAVAMAEQMRDLAAASAARAGRAARAASAASDASAAWAESAASAARAARAASAESAARAASAESAESAAWAESAASAASDCQQARKKIIAAAMSFLDAALPRHEITDRAVLDRADKLLALSA